jgi:hypothetical protein
VKHASAKKENYVDTNTFQAGIERRQMILVVMKNNNIKSGEGFKNNNFNERTLL